MSRYTVTIHFAGRTTVRHFDFFSNAQQHVARTTLAGSISDLTAGGFRSIIHDNTDANGDHTLTYE